MNRRVRNLAMATLGVAAATGLAGSLPSALATVSSGTRAIYVPITPCRLFDTRTGADNVGARATPLGAAETFTLAVRGTNGNCSIPAGAVGVAMNTTAVNGTSSSYLTVYPADVARPLASSLNWVAGQGASPNQLNVTLAADGRISLFNNAGFVDVIGDIVGYYEDHNHDDRTTTRSISFVAEGLNVFTGAGVIAKGGGLNWGYSGGGSAQVDIHRPLDAVPSSPITVTLMFSPNSAAVAGTTVQFFARPRDYNVGDPTLDAFGVLSDLVPVADMNFYEATIVLTPDSLPKEWWQIVIQRSAGLTNGFAGSVKVSTVEVSYTAYVVVPGS
jgi:hypothetical protein